MELLGNESIKNLSTLVQEFLPGIIFFDEQLGFIGLSKNGGSEGLIYRTEDGGVTFEKIEIPKVEVTVNEDLIYNPFDLPDMPYLENETLHMTVGQENRWRL